MRFKPDCAVGYYGVSIEKSLDEAKNLSNPLMLTHRRSTTSFVHRKRKRRFTRRSIQIHSSRFTLIPDRESCLCARPGGEHYNAADAELANLRSLEFFVSHLAGSVSRARNKRFQVDGTTTSSMNSQLATPTTRSETMVVDAYVNHVPVMTGGVGHDELREFYSKRFIPQMPPDTAMTPVSRTIGVDRVVDEMVFEFTHTIKMDWMLPGVEPTGKHVKVALVVIVHFRDGKLAHEHIYWDQASVLAQLGLIDATKTSGRWR